MHRIGDKTFYNIGDKVWYSMFPGEGSEAIVVDTRQGLIAWLFGDVKVTVTSGHSVGFTTWCDSEYNIY